MEDPCQAYSFGRSGGQLEAQLSLAGSRRAEHRFERRAQRRVRLRHGRGAAEVGEAGDAIVRFSDAARDDAGKMLRSGSTLSATPCSVAQRRTRTPMAAILSSAVSPSGDAGLSGRATHTPTRASRVSPTTSNAFSVSISQRSSDADIGPHVGPAALEVEHDVSDPLPGSVIGELAAAAGAMDRKAGFDEVALLRAGSGGVKRRMLDQPDALGRGSARDRLGSRLHLSQSVGILRQSRGDDPFDRRRVALGKQRRAGGGAQIEHTGFVSEGASWREGPSVMMLVVNHWGARSTPEVYRGLSALRT